MCFFFFFQAEDGIRDYKVTGVQTCALPISLLSAPIFLACLLLAAPLFRLGPRSLDHRVPALDFSGGVLAQGVGGDRKSTRLNSSHLVISYAVFCLKKKRNIQRRDVLTQIAINATPPYMPKHNAACLHVRS